jgi:hypothetical protein
MDKNLTGKIFFRKLTNKRAKVPILVQAILVLDGPIKNPNDEGELVYKVEHCTATPDAIFCEKTDFYDLMGKENDKNDVTTPIEETPIEDIRSFVKRIFRGNNG